MSDHLLSQSDAQVPSDATWRAKLPHQSNEDVNTRDATVSPV